MLLNPWEIYISCWVTSFLYSCPYLHNLCEAVSIASPLFSMYLSVICIVKVSDFFYCLWYMVKLSFAVQAENMIAHKEEIFSRPKRTWFVTEKEKKLASKAAKVFIYGATFYIFGWTSDYIRCCIFLSSLYIFLLSISLIFKWKLDFREQKIGIAFINVSICTLGNCNINI